MWKILTVQIWEEIYNSLISRSLFPVEQKGCIKSARRTVEQQYTEQHILNESKPWRKFLARLITKRLTIWFLKTEL